MAFLTAAFFFGAIILITKLFGMRYRASTSTRLQLRGLEPEPDVELYKCPIQTTMETLVEAGLQNDTAPHLVSRLEWWKQINSYLDMLADTPELISSVATAIEVLLTYHQLQRSNAEEDLVRALFQRALQDSRLSHLYTKLLQQMMNDTRDWTQDLASRLLQLAVAEFNRPFTHVEDFEKKLNNVKLMAAVFRRRIDGVPDEWMKDCSDTLIRRLQAGLEQSIEQLCIFLKTLLINECNDNCNLSESQQLELVACFEALQKAALCPKRSSPRLKAEVREVLPETEPEAQPEGQPEEQVEEQPETPSGTQPETSNSEVEDFKTIKKADLDQGTEGSSSTAELHNNAETPQTNPLDQIVSFAYRLFQGPSVEPGVPRDKISHPLSPTVLPNLMTVPEMEPPVIDDRKLKGGENQPEHNVQQTDEDSQRILNSNASTISNDSDASSTPDVFDTTPIEDKAQVQVGQSKIEPAHKTVEDSLLAVHHGKHWYEDPGETVSPPGLTSNDVVEVGKTILLADKTMVANKKAVVGRRGEKNRDVKGKSIKKKDTSGSDVKH
ncbi:hypothetical protein GHT06_020877 [Daphnia sinensis]|uniref:Uncharacterized protein n=1 Tax=Daphnia sinensis TaxID=1820382 RepID=A0AAD5PS19_9CRUS|nr:hypothetical protein GHT06_020877 [Daphnia sinensis]